MNAATARIAHLSRRYRFSASHRLHVEALGEAGNRELYGKCNNPYGHGHNYTVQVTVAGPIDEATGMVVNLADLDAFAGRELLERFDCTNLNEHACFSGVVPSTENLCAELWAIFQAFAAKHASVRLEGIRIEETNNNTFDYFGPHAPAASHTLSPALKGSTPTHDHESS